MKEKVPKEIEKVAAAWRANAKEAGMPEDSCLVEYEQKDKRAIREFYTDPWGSPDYRHKYLEGPSWEVACNYEKASSIFWFPEQNVWLMLSMHASACRPITGGLTGAIANAEIVYTG